MSYKVYGFEEQCAVESQYHPLADDFYRQHFKLHRIERITDKRLQKKGLDIRVFYWTTIDGWPSIEVVIYDEKFDTFESGNIFLETFSDMNTGAEGWLWKDECDAIMYVFVNWKTFIMLPIKSLRLAVERNRDKWFIKPNFRTVQQKGGERLACGFVVPYMDVVNEVEGSWVEHMTSIEVYDEEGLTIEILVRLTHSWLITKADGYIIDMDICNNVRISPQ